MSPASVYTILLLGLSIAATVIGSMAFGFEGLIYYVGLEIIVASYAGTILLCS
jgi:hypothetical protein